MWTFFVARKFLDIKGRNLYNIKITMAVRPKGRDEQTFHPAGVLLVIRQYS
jgi:hypothetical protein